MPRRLTTKKELQLIDLRKVVLSRNERLLSFITDKLLETKDSRGQAALHWAATIGSEGVVSRLLDRELDVKSKDSIFGRTALHWAAKNGQCFVSRQLLNKDDSLVNVRDLIGATALHYAAENGNESTVMLLLSEGADSDLQDQNERTPLMWAAVNEHEAVVRLLLNNGAQVNRKDNLGRTTLSLGAMSGQEKLMAMLIEKDANINSRDKHGWTPLWRASLNGNENILQLLIEKGAELEEQDSHGSTPLSWAAKGGHERMVNLLLRAGADPRLQDAIGFTPFDHAVSKGHSSIAQWLHNVEQVFAYFETSMIQLDAVRLSDVLNHFDKSHAERLLDLLHERTRPHASTDGDLGGQVLFGDVLGVDALAIAKFIAQLSTTLGRRVQFLYPSKAEGFYQYAAAIHETILEGFIQDVVIAEQFRREPRAVERYSDVRTHFNLLKLAVQRLGRWPQDYSINHERLNGDLFRHFRDYLKHVDGVELWNLKKFGSGKAEANDDLLDVDHMDSVLKLIRKADN